MKKIILLTIIIVGTCSLYAQEGAAFSFTFNHMALSVKNVDRSVEFYTKIFQLKEITNRSAKEGIRWISLGEEKELHLISVVKEPVVINKAVHIAITTQNVNAFAKQLEEMKIPYSDWAGKTNTISERADKVKQIYLQDPDGYWIEVNNSFALNDNDEIKNEVWQLEENYWKYVEGKNLQAYLELWDNNFIGYPSNNIITKKAHITDWITNLYKDNIGQFSYQLDRKVENVFDDIAIVLYDVTQIFTNEKNKTVKKTTYKITHTWKKMGSSWVIIGGMGATK